MLSTLFIVTIAFLFPNYIAFILSISFPLRPTYDEDIEWWAWIYSDEIACLQSVFAPILPPG